MTSTRMINSTDNVIVSIVTGTYNRFHQLKRMVESIRSSAAGLRYEIVVVDGGSSDGSQEWCKSQADISLIEQYKLLGAVKAFNAGAEYAVGKYVILANDDIVFLNEGILVAVAFMEDNIDNVGIGCFYQDRNGKDMHVEYMEAHLNGVQIYVPYGQVCILLKELGNKVGWWGNYLHTYGGDNELSCNVLELGLRIEPMKYCCIHDSAYDDDLRAINNPTVLTEGTHPDTLKWIRKWRKKGNVFGAIIPPKVLFHHDHKRMIRVVYMPIYEQGHRIQKQTKVGLRQALEANHCIVLELEHQVLNDEELLYKTISFAPDLLIVQCQDAKAISLDVMTSLNKELPNTVFVSWNGDYHETNLYNINYMALLRHFHYSCFAVADNKFTSYCKKHGVNHRYWQIGYEPHTILDAVPGYDVVFMGNCYSQTRQQLGATLRWLESNFGTSVGIYGNWDASIHANGETLYDFSTGASIYTNSKIAVSDQQWPYASGYVSNRLFQILSAGGCIVLQQEFDGMSKYLGLIDGVHLRTWKNNRELVDLIHYYLDPAHEQERASIAEAGCNYVRNNHSFDVRVKELWNMLSWHNIH